MAEVYLGLGANIGDPRANLRRAVEALGRECEVVAVSSLYATEPVGYLDQNWFLNAAAHVRTGRKPREMLSLLQGIEAALGRERAIPNGPRMIDLDILLWDAKRIDEPGLRIPHPRMHGRLFVMEPLWELAPDAVVPGLGQTVAELRAALQGTMAIRLEARAPW